MDTRSESGETTETPKPARHEKLTPKGIANIRGPDQPEPDQAKLKSSKDQVSTDRSQDSPSLVSEGDAFAGSKDQASTDQSQGRQRELRYEIGSPHDDFRFYMDLEKAKRQAELGRAAATAGGEDADPVDLPGAAVTTLRAAKEARADESELDKQFSEWLRLKHGPAPYRTLVRTELVDEEQVPSLAELRQKPSQDNPSLPDDAGGEE